MKRDAPFSSTYNFDDVFDNTAIGMAIIDDEDHIIKVNSFLLKMFDYQSDELIFQPITCLFPSICQGANQNPILGLTRKKQIFPIEIIQSHFVSQNRNYKTIIITNLSAQQKKINDLVESSKRLSLTNDHYNQQIAEYITKLTISNQRLEELLNLQESVLNNMSVMTFLLDQDGYFQFINLATTFYSGFTKEELLKKENVTLFFEDSEINQCRESMYEEYGVIIEQDINVIRLMAEKNKVKDKECFLKNKTTPKLLYNLL